MNDGNNGSARIDQTIRDLRTYVNLKYAALKLSLVESLSELFSNIIAILIISVFIILVIMLLTTALVLWLGAVLGSFITAALIVGGFYLLIAVVVMLFHNRFMTNTMVRMFSRMFFKHKKESYEEE